MARALSQDLQDRVVSAIDGGLSCRAAAARFGVGVAKRFAGGNWRCVMDGRLPASRAATSARRRPMPTRTSSSAWSLSGAISRWPRCRRRWRSVVRRSGWARCGGSSIAAGSRVKKDRPRDRTGPARRPEPQEKLVRGTDRPRTRAPRVHRRNLDRDQHDPQPWPLRHGRAAAHGLPPRPPQDDHAGRGAAHDRDGRADGARRADQWRLVRSLCRPGARARTAARRCRHHGQPVEPQAGIGSRSDRAAGATLRFLPPYSPDFNPIEKAFSKLKAMLRKIGERSVNGLWELIGRLVDIFQSRECANYFSSCGYDPD